MLCSFLEYSLRTATDDREGLTLTRRRSSRHLVSHLSGLDYADDIVLFADTIQEAELLLRKVESASKSTGLFLNPSNTKYIHINSSANDSVHSSDGSQIEKVEVFKYLGSYTNCQHDIQCRKEQAWAAVHVLDKVWRASICRLTKPKISRTMVEPIVIYVCDSWSLTQLVKNALDGTYTRMLQKILNVSWRHHMTNHELYGSLPRITTIVRQRRLRLAGHVMRYDEAANKVLLWKPDGPRRKGRPTTTLQNTLEKDTNLSGTNLIAAMKNRNLWKEIIMSPH